MGILTSLGTMASGATPYLYAAVLAIGLAGGSVITYKIEHAEVLSMELKISNQKVEAAQILAVETNKVAVAEDNQRKINVEKDRDYAKLKKDSDISNSQLISTIDQLQFSKRGSGSSSTTGKGNNSPINTGDDSQFTWISKKLLKFLAGESKRADQDGLDKNRLLDFVMQDNCGIPK
jgi:hypothetical protein